MSTRLQVYEADGITVTFDPAVCAHSGVCVRGLPDVFDVQFRRWIRPERALAARVAEQVARCPSGALQVRWPEGRSPAGHDDAGSSAPNDVSR